MLDSTRAIGNETYERLREVKKTLDDTKAIEARVKSMQEQIESLHQQALADRDAAERLRREQELEIERRASELTRKRIKEMFKDAPESRTLDGAAYRSIPKPTFIVLSGRGLHLYYVFNEPIALYPNIKLQLKSLKHDLTFKIWDYKGTSQIENIQYQSIGQGFRMVGSINSKYGNIVTAFQTGDRVSLDFLNSYAIKPENRVDVKRPYRPSKVDRATAAVLYPEWYQRVVVEGDKRPKKWNIGYRKKKQVKDYALYEWWKRRVTEIEGGHRYFFLMCLVIYACKCDVPKSQLKADMQECFDVLRLIDYENELTD